jgi:hypothetical protein
MGDPRDDTREHWIAQDRNEYALNALLDKEDEHDHRRNQT